MPLSMHPPDGDLRALLDGELDDAPRQNVVRHTASCATCYSRLLELERDVETTDELLGLLTPPPSALTLTEVAQHAVPGPRRGWLIAATIALVILASAGAVVAAPFIRSLVSRVFHSRPSTALQQSSGAGQTAIALAPAAVTDIRFTVAQPDGVLRVSLADSTELVIRSSTAVSYRVFPGGLSVENVGTPSFDILLPRAAPRVNIVVAGHVVLEKVGPRVLAAVAPDSAGRYLLPVR